MKRIKLISTAIAIALILTVGGVYATFIYSQATPDAVSTNWQSNIISEAVTSGKKGTISVTVNTLTLRVDNKADNKTGLDKITGILQANFIPATGADADVITNGIVWGIKITFTNNTFRNQDILTTTTTGATWNSVALNNGAKSLSVTIDEAALTGLIDVTEFELPTYADYQAYKTAFEAVVINIEVGEYVS